MSNGLHQHQPQHQYPNTRPFLIILFLGLVLRLLLVPQPGFEADVAYWKSWSLAASDKGIVWLAQNTNYNYPAGFAHILWLMGRAYRLFANPGNFQQYWQTSNYLFLLICKLPAIICDLAVVWGIYYLLTHPHLLDLPKSSSRLALPLSAVFLFHPVVLYDGAWWGQVDSLGVVFALFSLIFVFKKKPILASILLTTGFMLKLQVIVFLPLFFLYLGRNFSWQTMVKGLGAAFITYLAWSFPFLLEKSLERTFYLIWQNADWFPLLSLRAYNLWWLVSKGAGMEISDKILTLGITSAKTLGLILFSSFYFLATGLVFSKPNPKNLLFAFVLAGLAFFLFPTQSHERYIFPSFVLFFLVLVIFWEQPGRRRLVLTLFTLLSVSIFLNLNTSMLVNYPQNGLGFLAPFSQPAWEIAFSLFNLTFFFVFLFLVLKQLPFVWKIGALGLLAGGVLLTNLDYLIKNQISLTRLSSIAATQDYGSLQVNRNLSSMFGPKSWSFLSVNYFFYRQGLGTHANSEIVFDLGQRFRRLATDFGVDTAGEDTASVIFEIYGDGKQLFRSPKMTKADLPGHAEISLEGIKTLVLMVNDAGDGINGDHANWLEPTLYK